MIGVIGEALVDIVTGPGGTTVDRPGGACLNVAVGLGRLGNQTTFFTSIGSDPRGEVIRDWVSTSGVRLVVPAAAAATSTSAASVDADGRASYQFDLRWDVDFGSRDWAELEAVHYGSIAAVLAPGARTVTEIVDRYVGRSFVSYDPNCRPSLMPGADHTRHLVEANIVRSDLVKCSDEDASWLYPGESLDGIARRWLGLGPALVIVTQGAKGSSAWTWRERASVPATDVREVVDTVGAGDAYTAALLHFLPSLTAGSVRALPAEALTKVLCSAADLAARTCQRAGADPPWLREL